MTRNRHVTRQSTRHPEVGRSRRVLRFAGVVAAATAAMVLLTGGVPWVENKSLPTIDGRETLSETQRADEAYVRGRESFLQALEFEQKARAARSDGKRRRYEARAFARFKASADAFAMSLKRALDQDYTPDYLPALYLEMADALFKTGRYEASIEAYGAALTRAPAFLRARYGLGRAQLATGRLAAVRACYETLLTEAQTRAQAWDYVDALMADVSLWLGDEQATSTATEDVAALRHWRDVKASELEDTIRWTALDARTDADKSR